MGGRHQNVEDRISWTWDIKKTKCYPLGFLLDYSLIEVGSELEKAKTLWEQDFIQTNFVEIGAYEIRDKIIFIQVNDRFRTKKQCKCHFFLNHLQFYEFWQTFTIFLCSAKDFAESSIFFYHLMRRLTLVTQKYRYLVWLGEVFIKKKYGFRQNLLLPP